MVVISYHWSPSNWLMQGLLTSILSGIGFVVFTIVFEYAKKYSRERKEHDQQIMLQKILRGEVVMDWKNPKALIPFSGYSVGALQNRGSLLFSAYRQYGGFLGIGRGYYGSRNGNAEVRENDSDNLQNRMIKYTNWSTSNDDKSEQNDLAQSSSDPTIKLFSRKNSMFEEIGEFSRKIQKITEPLSLGRTQDAGKHDNQDGSTDQISKKMCEEMCLKIVQDHPYIAPFLRKDLLHELNLDSLAASYPCVMSPSSSIASKQKLNLLRHPSKQTILQSPDPAKYQPLCSKNLRQISRSWNKKPASVVSDLCRWDSSLSKSSNANERIRTNEQLMLKAKPVPKSESPLVQNVASIESQGRLRKRFRSKRSFSVAGKSAQNEEETNFKPAKAGDFTPVASKFLSVTTLARIQEEIAEKGSSVDPLILSSNMNKTVSNINDYIEKQSQRSLPQTESIMQIPAVNVSIFSSTTSEINVLGKETGATAECRINEILSALTSWGFPIRRQTEPPKSSSLTIDKMNMPERVQNPCGNQLQRKPTLPTQVSDSRALLDLIECLAGSEKKRKLFREISYVLDKTKEEKPPAKAKDTTESSKAQRLKSLKLANKTQYVNISKSKVTNLELLRNKTLAELKKTRLIRQRSFMKKPRESLKPYLETQQFLMKTIGSESVLIQSQATHVSSANKTSLSAVTKEQEEKNNDNTTASKKQRKSPRRFPSKVPIASKQIPLASDEIVADTNCTKGSSKLPPRAQSQDLKKPKRYSSFSRGENEMAVITYAVSSTSSIKSFNEKSHENSMKTQLGNKMQLASSREIPNVKHTKEKMGFYEKKNKHKPTANKLRIVKEGGTQTSQSFAPSEPCSRSKKSPHREHKLRTVATNTKNTSPQQLTKTLQLLKSIRPPPHKVTTEVNTPKSTIKSTEKQAETKQLVMKPKLKSKSKVKKDNESTMSLASELSAPTTKLISDKRHEKKRSKHRNRNNDAYTVDHYLNRSPTLRKTHYTIQNVSKMSRKREKSAHKYSSLSSAQKTEVQTNQQVKHGTNTRSFSDKKLLVKPNGKSPALLKMRKIKSEEIQSRFDKFINSKDITNDIYVCEQNPEKHNQEIAELNKGIRQARAGDLLLQAVVRQNSISREIGELNVVTNINASSQNLRMLSRSGEQPRQSLDLESEDKTTQMFSQELSIKTFSEMSYSEIVPKAGKISPIIFPRNKDHEQSVKSIPNRQINENSSNKHEERSRIRDLLKNSVLDGVVSNMLINKPS